MLSPLAQIEEPAPGVSGAARSLYSLLAGILPCGGRWSFEGVPLKRCKPYMSQSVVRIQTKFGRGNRRTSKQTFPVMELPTLRDRTVTPPLQLESIAAVEDATGMDTESPTRDETTDAMLSTGCIEPGVTTQPGRSGESVPPNQIRRLSAVVDASSEVIESEVHQIAHMVGLQPKAGAMFVAQSICQRTASPRTIAEIRQKAQSDALREATQMFAER